MRNILAAAFFFTITPFYSQNYGLDTSFGTNGVAAFPAFTTWPIDIIPNGTGYILPLYNGSLISITPTGQLDTTYGNSGAATITFPNEYVALHNWVHSGGFFYVVGEVNNNSLSGNSDIVVAKLSENGAFDTSFGNNGVARIDIGGYDVGMDITVQANGSLFITGYRQISSPYSVRAFLLKLNASGSPDTGFGTAGHTIFSGSGTTERASVILPYDNGFLICGTSATNPNNLMLIHVDQTGSLVPTFGSNGIKVIPLAGGIGSVQLHDAQFDSNEDLVFSYLYAVSFSGQNTVSGRLNTETWTLDSNSGSGYYTNPFFRIDASGNIWQTGAERCTWTPCSRKYKLTKLNNVFGNVTSFSNGGTFEYGSFSPVGIGDYISSAFYLQEDGSILLAGLLYSPYTAPANGVGIIRIGASLGLPEAQKEAAAIIPNPTSGAFNIGLSPGTSVKSVAIFDLQGKCLLRFPPSQIYTADTLRPGVYVVEITTDKGTSTLKLVKSGL